MQQVSIRSNHDLATVLARQANGSDQPLGQLLLASSLIDEQQLDQTLARQAWQMQREDSSYRRLGEMLIDQGLVSRQHIHSLLADKFAIPCVSLTDCQVPAEVLALVPSHLVLQYHLLPLSILNQRLVVACETPWDNEGLDLLRFHTGMSIDLVMATADDITMALGRYYSKSDEDEALQDSGKQAEALSPQGAAWQRLEQQANKRPIVRLLNAIVMQGLLRAASDIHIRPTASMVDVLYRIDGQLQWIRSIDKDLLAALVSRAKIISRLNIAERRLPQDGHARFQRGKHQVDLRLSVIPTIHGESMVIRLLDPLTGIKQLVDLGLPTEQYQRLQALARQRSGLILVVGATGSGKSTTLYSLLNEIRRDGRHILTVEDPVEYHIDGVEQVQLNERKGLGFSNVLRHFLRHDPDVIMVGEIRDQPTVELAVRAALTGHLVLSTLHTNDAPSAVSRLLNMGIEPYLLSSTLLAVMAQGLIRINCAFCRVDAQVDTRLDPAMLESLSAKLDSSQALLKGQGCAACHHSGYKGRRVVSELMLVDELMTPLINSQVPLPQLRRHAIEQGMRPLSDQAWALVREGQTTVEEALGFSGEVQGNEFHHEGHEEHEEESL